MLLTQGLSRISSSAWRALVLVACLLTVMTAAASALTPVEWPDGWSREHSIGAAVLSYGHRTVPWGDSEMWLAMVTSTSSDVLRLDARLLDIQSGETKAQSSLPIEHLLKGYSLATHSSGLAVTWIERNEGVLSQLWFAQVNSDGQILARRLLWQSAALAETPELAIDESGVVHVAFTATEDGQHSVQLISFELSDDKNAIAYRLTPTSEVATLPVIAVRDGNLHLMYYRHTTNSSSALYQLYDLSTRKRLGSIEIGNVPEYYKYPPGLFADDGVVANIVWQRMVTGSGNRVSPGPAVHGRIRYGDWEQSFTPIIAGQARIAGARASRSANGEMLVTWLAQSGSTWQAFAVLRDADGNNVRAGFATLAQGNILELRPLLVGDTGVVSFFRRLPTGPTEVFYAHTGSPAKKSIAYRIGLDPHTPLTDALFKYVTLLTASAAWVFLALGALLVSLAVIAGLSYLGLLSSSSVGLYLRFGLQFVLLAIIKRPGNLLYYGAQIIPGWGSVVSWLGAAVFSLAVIHLSDMASDDYLALALAGLLFMLSDAFTSLFVLGVGRW